MTERYSPECRRSYLANSVIRRVPLDWAHPTDENSDFIPLRDRQNPFSGDEIDELVDEGVIKSPEDLESQYMPDFSSVPDEEMGICAYEEITGGTPMSPVLLNTEKGRYWMVKYCADIDSMTGENIDVDTWAGKLFGDADLSVYCDHIEEKVFLRPNVPQ